MEIYQLSKYENIADRLKRLSSPTHTAQPDPKSHLNRDKPRPYEERRDAIEQPFRNKYTQGAAYSKFSTLESERAEEHPSYTRIQSLLSPRQPKPTEKIEKIATMNSIESRSNIMKIEDEEPNPLQKYQAEERDSKAALPKVKSDGNFKIDEILESFNNYKQNKEKFLSSLNKTLPNVEVQDTPFLQNLEKMEKNQLDSQRYIKDKRIFQEIDNIWNGSESTDDAPKFERSFARKNTVEQIADVFSPVTLEPMERPKNFSRSKLILKNVVKQVQVENAESTALKTLISPRGPRIPGKICRNNDRTFTGYAREDR